MGDNWHTRYQQLLENSSKAWGLDHVHTDMIPTDERLDDGPNRSCVDLFTFNGKWSFSLCLSWSTGGTSHGNFLKFCTPYESRSAAIAAARAKIKKRVPADDRDRSKFVRWANTLGTEQLTLF